MNLIFRGISIALISLLISRSPAQACDVTIDAGASIDQAVQASPPGTVFCLPAGIWHQQAFQTKDYDVFIGDDGGGTILDGDGTSGGGWVGVTDGAADGTTGVELHNITVQNYVSATAINTGSNWMIYNVTSQYISGYNGTDYGIGLVIGGPNTTVSGGHFLNNAHGGIEGGHDGTIIQGAEIAYNNTRGDDPDHDPGGIKVCGGNDNQIINNYVHDNYSFGIWSDCGNTGWVIDGNTVANNMCSGIQFEVSDGGAISNNIVNDNGVGCGFRGGIQIGQSSGDTDVHGNNVRVPVGAAFGIFMQAEPRSDAQTTAKNVIHDNTVTFMDSGGLEGFNDDGGPVGSGNLSNNNTFCVANANDAHWIWGSGFTPLDWSTYSGQTGQDSGSRLLARSMHEGWRV
jgi:parallel beta-helix repeat protein